MYIASQKHKENIAEYLLYMWQIEDMIRANGLDIDRIKTNIIDRSPSITPEQRKKMTEWYESLIDMMRSEGVEKSGHLQLNKNVIIQLNDLHRALLHDTRFPEYNAEFYRTLPYIVELRAKAGENPSGEIETCFNALYGALMLRLQGKEVSPSTQAALTQISRFLALLNRCYILDRDDRLFPHEDSDPTVVTTD